jgi:choline dehydrogenase-like flavoprotein
MRTQFDVVIIGSGAGGAPIAHILAKAGKTVLVLEKGPLFRPQYQTTNKISDFKRDELYATGPEKSIQIPNVANRGVSYYCSHVEPDINDEPHVYRGSDGQDRATIEGYTAHLVGGGTQLYGSISLRFSPMDLRLKSVNDGRSDLRNDPNGEVQREARNWPISYEQLERYYCEAEELLGINGTQGNQRKPFSRQTYQSPLQPNPISNHVERGMDALDMPRYRTPLAIITEDHAPSGRKMIQNRESAKTAYINRYGDPLGLKSSAWTALLSPIYDLPNFELRANCMVMHLASNGGQAQRVFYLDPGNEERFVEGKIVIVACSAIESIRLLKISAARDAEFERRVNPHNLLGAYFLTHCFGGASANVPAEERYDKSLTLDSDWATDFGIDEQFMRTNGLWAGGVMYNNTSDRALPISLARTYGSTDLDTFWKGFIEDTSLTGEQLAGFLDRDFGRTLSMTFMANQVPQRDNRIELHPTLRDKWGLPPAYVLKTWHPHDRALMDTYANLCAEVLTRGNVTERLGEGGVYMAENALARCANHILGGARFGTDANDSVLDPNCRVWDFDNLYVTDGAFMPTSGSANPTLTIEANALRVADHLLRRL